MYNVFSEFIFPRHIIICDDDEYPSYKQQLIKQCYEEFIEDCEGVKYSNSGGWQSRPKYSFKEGDKLYFFVEKLKKIVSESFSKQGSFIEETNFTITRIWINISGNGAYNHQHTHPFCHYSGIFYVKTKERCGNVVFSQHIYDSYDSIFRTEQFKEDNNYSTCIHYKPIEGRTLLFPSNLIHAVEKNNSESDRISISFDISFHNHNLDA